MTLKIGQKVRVKKNFWELPNPTGLTISNSKINLAGKVLEIEEICDDGDVVTKQGTLGDGINTWLIWHPSWLELVEKPLETLEKGDIVVDSHGNYKKVLSVLEEGEMYALSYSSEDLQSDELKAYSSIRTLFELQEDGYKPYIPEKNDEVEMTVAEISKALGKTVKVVE